VGFLRLTEQQKWRIQWRWLFEHHHTRSKQLTSASRDFMDASDWLFTRCFSSQIRGCAHPEPYLDFHHGLNTYIMEMSTETVCETFCLKSNLPKVCGGRNKLSVGNLMGPNVQPPLNNNFQRNWNK
jgi:hypothetical protein